MIPTALLSGDIAFLKTILAKEDINGNWSYLCDLSKSCWQLKGHNTGFPWTIERRETICEQAMKVFQGNLTYTNCKGLKEELYFKFTLSLELTSNPDKQ